MAKYYQPEIETMPYEQLRALQNERLVKQVHHVWNNVPYYRKNMDKMDISAPPIAQSHTRTQNTPPHSPGRTP